MRLDVRILPQLIVLVFMAMSFGTTISGQQPAATREAATPEQVKNWIEQLGSQRFALREHATRELIAAGPSVIEPLVEAIPEIELEASSRGLTVLRELALLDNADATRAEAAIRELSLPAVTSLSQRAKQVLDTLDGMRTERGVRILKRLGAEFSYQSDPYSERLEADIYVTFGKRFRGQASDLAYLKWLSDYRTKQITLHGPMITDEWLPALADTDGLVGLQLNRTSVTNEGLSIVKQLPNLQWLSLRYIAVDSTCIPFLEEAVAEHTLNFVAVYGTQISGDDITGLDAAYPSLETRYRVGGFLGVSGSSMAISSLGCVIASVQPNQAAHRAGLRPHDVVLTYNGVPVKQFTRQGPDTNEPTLAELIAEHPAGKTVEMQIRRGNRTLTKLVQLGEWP